MTGSCRGPVLRELDFLFRHGTLSGLGDDELLERFLNRRDGSAFEALLSLHGPMVLGICRRMLRDPRDVEDAFQATFLVLVQKASTIRDRGQLSSWLYGVAYRVANRARTRAIQHQVREIAAGQLDLHAGDVPPDIADIAPVLDQELSRLPAKYREPIVLCYLEGCTHDQAAERLRCPVGTVRSRMARGRDLLRRRLTRRGCSPVALLMAGGASLPSSLSLEAIPQELLSTTVRLALEAAAVRGLQASSVAAPVLALTQGVLTTMKLRQLAWIAVAILATSASTTGVVAVALARGQSAGGAGSSVAQPQTTAEPSGRARFQSRSNPAQSATEALAERLARQNLAQGGSTPAQSATEALEARLKAVESKLDALLSRTSTATSSTGTATSTQSSAASAFDALRKATNSETATTSTTATNIGDASGPAGSATTRTTLGLLRSAALSAMPIRPSVSNPSEVGQATAASGMVGSVRELEMQLELALESFDHDTPLYRDGRISHAEFERLRGKVLLAAAVLEGLDDDLAYELERLQLEMKRMQAELRQTEGQREVALSIVARNRRLNDRRPGVVDPDSVAKAEGELKIAEAQIDAKKIEIEEVALKSARLTRSRKRIEQAIKTCDRVRKSVPSPPAGDGPQR